MTFLLQLGHSFEQMPCIVSVLRSGAGWLSNQQTDFISFYDAVFQLGKCFHICAKWEYKEQNSCALFPSLVSQLMNT